MALRLSLRTKLTGAHLIGVLMLLVVTAVSLYSISDLYKETNSLKRLNQTHTIISDLELSLAQTTNHLNRYSLSGDNADKQAFAGAAAIANSSFGRAISDPGLNEGEKAILEKGRAQFLAANGSALQIFNLEDLTNEFGRGRLLATQGMLQNSLNTIRGVNANQIHEVNERFARAEEMKSQVTAFLAVLGISAIIVGLIASFMLHRLIAVPIHALVRAVKRISVGDLDVRVETRSKDEIADLAASFNAMAHELKLSRDNVETYSHDLERRVIERTRELTALNVMSNVATQSLDLDKIVSDTFRKVLDLVGIEGGMVHIWDEDRQQLILKVSKQVAPEIVYEIEQLDREDQLPVATFRTGEARLVDNLQTSNNREPFTRLIARSVPDAKSLISIPLRAKNTVIGAMTLLSTSRNTISPSDITLLTSIAHQIGVAAENARLFENTRDYAETIAVLGEIDRAILSSLSLDDIIQQVISNVQRLIDCNFTSLALLEGDGRSVRISGKETTEVELQSEASIPTTQTLTRQALQLSEPMVINDLSTERDLPTFERKLVEHGARSYALVPLSVRGEHIGTLNLGSNKRNHFTARDIGLAESLVNQVAIAIDNAKLYETQKIYYVNSIKSLAAAVDARDPYTAGHSERVAEYAVRIGLELGLSESELQTLQFAGLLHDIGKIGIADDILKKPGPLDPAERTIMISHAAISHTILSRVDTFNDIALPVRHHHEWYGGGGYPDSLKGTDIPLAARILSVADAFEAMTSTRPYRKALPIESARASLSNGEGVQFDPRIVEAFLEILGREEATKSQLWQSLVARTQHSDQPNADPARSQTEVGLIHPSQGQSLTILYGIAQEMHAILDLPLLLERILGILASVHGKGCYSILLINQETKDLTVMATTVNQEKVIGTTIPAGTGITGWVAENGRPSLVTNTSEDPRHIAAPETPTLSELAVPLVVEGRTIGVLDVSCAERSAFVSEDIRLLTAVAAEIAAAIEVAQLHEKMRDAAIHDGLTNIYNHRYFYDRLESELKRAHRYKRPLTIAVFDVDGLKDVNDTFGHLAGDNALRVTARALAENIRACDIAARYGGDEFVIIMPETDLPEAELIVKRLMESMDEMSFEVGDRKLMLPGRSYGTAVYPTGGSTPAELFAVADSQVRAGKKHQGDEDGAPAKGRTHYIPIEQSAEFSTELNDGGERASGATP